MMYVGDNKATGAPFWCLSINRQLHVDDIAGAQYVYGLRGDFNRNCKRWTLPTMFSGAIRTARRSQQEPPQTATLMASSTAVRLPSLARPLRKNGGDRIRRAALVWDWIRFGRARAAVICDIAFVAPGVERTASGMHALITRLVF